MALPRPIFWMNETSDQNTPKSLPLQLSRDDTIADLAVFITKSYYDMKLLFCEDFCVSNTSNCSINYHDSCIIFVAILQSAEYLYGALIQAPLLQKTEYQIILQNSTVSCLFPNEAWYCLNQC
jgi:hypothetical protein